MTFVGDPEEAGLRPGRPDRRSTTSAHLATLSGSASLWQDTSSLFADDITLSDAEKTVTAVQNVRAVLSPSKDRRRREGRRGAPDPGEAGHARP